MKINLLLRTAFLLVMFIAAGFVQAKEVTLVHQGLMLNARLVLVDGKNLGDGVILITHGALAHRDMEMITYMRKLLTESGHNTLSINLSLGLDNRHGMYDCKIASRHQNQDAVNEINAWVSWLKNQGTSRITLLGHSRGGAQTALYMATRNNPLVKSVVLMAPAIGENTSAKTYQMRYGKPLAPVLESAEKLVSAGKGNTVIENINMMSCRDTPATAQSFVSYYGRDARVDTPALLEKINKPTLVIVAGDDSVVTGLEKKISHLVTSKRLKMSVIDGAGHMFRDLNTDDAVDAMMDFFDGV